MGTATASRYLIGRPLKNSPYHSGLNQWTMYLQSLYDQMPGHRRRMGDKLDLEATEAVKRILEETRRMIRESAKGDKEIEFRIRHYIRIRLEHDERGKPLERKLMKLRKFAEQRGLCAVCGKSMTLEEEPHLHRIVASNGYTLENTLLIHHACHREQQRAKGFQ